MRIFNVYCDDCDTSYTIELEVTLKPKHCTLCAGKLDLDNGYDEEVDVLDFDEDGEWEYED